MMNGAPGFWWRRGGLVSTLMSPVGKLAGSLTLKRMDQEGGTVPVPVFCIGNPTVGGAGKTPTAIAVLESLKARGASPFALLRGHGGSATSPLHVDPATHGPDLVGDEALVLARHAPTIISGGSDRLAAASLAVSLGASHIIMDDGFQNPTLHKDAAILVVDAGIGVGNGAVLPAGPLRAPLEPQLKKADALLLIGQNGLESGGPGDQVKQAALAAGCVVLHGHIEPDVDILASLKGATLHAFAGIGHPEKFFNTLTRAGLEVSVTRAFPDHHPFRESEIEGLVEQASLARALLVTTQKDMARLLEPRFKVLRERIISLPIRLVLDEPEQMEALIAAAEERAKARMQATPKPA
ncbi:tetraacyldisaccharide 4'-kinase [Xanthobacter sp. TB0136]|uniref:tetraacyldisaccharide 4'-kinase n=1 Tax=Xanthobacter sp. TB0136 TaxID=3459177 RepID=UPI00403932A7